MNKTLTFKISVFSGDIIYALAGIRQACFKANKKASIYLWLNRPLKSYEGAVHPYGVDDYALRMMKPLVESQPWVECFEEWKGQQITVDLDQIRTEKISTMPQGSILRWYGQIWPDMQCDGSKAWIEFPNWSWHKQTTDKILINRTGRWRNDMIHYWFLKEIKDQLIFTGLPEEHEAFCKQWELDIPLLIVNDFLDLAIALKSCRYFIGNQSLCFAIAEAMKVPRLLEICPFAPNVIPCGPDGYDFLHQWALEWFVRDKDSQLN